MIVMKKQKNYMVFNKKILDMQVRLTTIIMNQYVCIEHICHLAYVCNKSYKTLSVQDKINKLNYILFLISLIKEEDIKLLNKEEAKRYKCAIEWVWDEINNVTHKIINNNVNYCDLKLNEEDLSKLSKEELIARLKEATK